MCVCVRPLHLNQPWACSRRYFLHADSGHLHWRFATLGVVKAPATIGLPGSVCGPCLFRHVTCTPQGGVCLRRIVGLWRGQPTRTLTDRVVWVACYGGRVYELLPARKTCTR